MKVTAANRQSIHPRVVNGRTVSEKVNTAQKSTGARQQRVIASLQARVEEHPNDAMAAQRLAKLLAS